jgi:hypothetical protein
VSPSLRLVYFMCFILKSSYHLHIPFQLYPGSILSAFNIIAIVADAHVEG